DAVDAGIHPPDLAGVSAGRDQVGALDLPASAVVAQVDPRIDLLVDHAAVGRQVGLPVVRVVPAQVVDHARPAINPAQHRIGHRTGVAHAQYPAHRRARRVRPLHAVPRPRMRRDRGRDGHRLPDSDDQLRGGEEDPPAQCGGAEAHRRGLLPGIGDEVQSGAAQRLQRGGRV
ncbi:MAG: hypothetical protein MI924_37115, partial [Chloroflexales bacterium]|nr:hypothetical protein [Chloroflexales bacterium]